jgi:ABC-2 type transport system ATP-binding protein
VKGLSAADRAREIHQLLEVLDLGEERSRLIRTYSQGMRRKMALAGAMLGRPPILILDEALNGLDPTTNHRLKVYLRELASNGTAILLSSHVLEVLERLCNRIAVMRRGRIVDQRNEAELETIRQQPGGLEQHFLSLMGEPVEPTDRRGQDGGG